MDKTDPKVKPPTTFAQQIEKMKCRGMIIDDVDRALSVLRRVNYYRFTAYTLTYRHRGNDSYKPGTTFKKVYDLYEFDRKLRHLLVGVLESVEISFRTRLAYYSGHKHGSLGYEQSENFIDESRHTKMLAELAQSISNRQEVFVDHHIKNYDSQFPVWVALELLSFGVTSKFYANLKQQDQISFASEFYNTTPDFLSTWLRTAVHFRNVCAHYGRLYNKFLKVTPKLHDRHKGRLHSKKLFTGIFVLRELCASGQDWRTFVTSLEGLIEQYSYVLDLHNMGFPSNWIELLTDVSYTKKL